MKEIVHTFPNGYVLTEDDINIIRKNAGLGERRACIFPKTSKLPPLLCYLDDGGMTSEGSPIASHSVYTVNLETLRPTRSSTNKSEIPFSLYDKFGGGIIVVDNKEDKKVMKQTRLLFKHPTNLSQK